MSGKDAISVRATVPDVTFSRARTQMRQIHGNHARTLSLAQQIIGKDSIFFEPTLEIGHNRPLQTYHRVNHLRLDGRPRFAIQIT
jgi:hypothetical protein